MGNVRQHRAFAAAITFAGAFSTVSADMVATFPMSQVLDWEKESQMQMSIGADGFMDAYLYTVIPLTTDLGLNESQTNRGVGRAFLVVVQTSVLTHHTFSF